MSNHPPKIKVHRKSFQYTTHLVPGLRSVSSSITMIKHIVSRQKIMKSRKRQPITKLTVSENLIARIPLKKLLVIF